MLCHRPPYAITELFHFSQISLPSHHGHEMIQPSTSQSVLRTPPVMVNVMSAHKERTIINHACPSSMWSISADIIRHVLISPSFTFILFLFLFFLLLLLLRILLRKNHTIHTKPSNDTHTQLHTHTKLGNHISSGFVRDNETHRSSRKVICLCQIRCYR